MKRVRRTFTLERTFQVHRLVSAVALVFALAIVTSARSDNFTRAKASPKADKTTTGESRFAKLDLGPVVGAVRIHYVNYGKGSEALVLIHGWTMNVDNWRDQIPEFAKHNRVIAIDLPGHGLSDKPQTSYSMDLFARAVEAVMRDAKVKRALLVGHSMGTPVARQFYRKYPEQTIGIVVVDGALRPFGDKAFFEKLIGDFRGPNYREAGTQFLGAIAGKNLTAETQERINASFMNTPQHVLVSAMEGMADDSIWGDDKVNVPVLAIMAKLPFYPPDLEQTYRAVAPNMEFQMWEGVGHMIMMEKPKAFNEAVLAFLNKNHLLKR